MSSTDSESESGKGEEEEEEEPQKSSEGEEGEEEEEAEEADEAEDEEENEEEEEENEAGDAEDEDEKEGENGHTSQVDEPGLRSSKRRRKSTSSYGAVANGNGSRSRSSSKPTTTKAASLTTLAFPIGRVRRLVKSEVDVHNVGADAGFLIAKATELFLEKFVEDAFDKMMEDERIVLNYSDLASHVSATERYDFLADFVPETVPVSTALAAKVQQADR